MACVRYILVTFILLLWLTASSFSRASGEGDGYVVDACSVTRYQNLCIHSLASYSNTAKRDPVKWARAGVSVTIVEAKNATRYLMALKRKKNSIKGRNRVALFDCIEVFQDTLDNLHKSLGVLRQLSAETFDTQIGDVTTWISTAITDEDTCLNGFEGQKVRQIKLLQKKVTRVSYITSNALALVVKLASAGP